MKKWNVTCTLWRWRELFLCWHAWCIWRHCTLMHILSKTQNEETLWPILHAGGLPWLGYSVLQNACIDCYVPSDAVFCRWRDCPTRCTHISTRCTWLSSMPCEIVSIFRGELDGTMRIEMSFYCRVYLTACYCGQPTRAQGVRTCASESEHGVNQCRTG